MSWQFRKSKSLGNGIRLNFGKNGIGLSGGIKGLRYSKSADGNIRRTISIPGTGLRKTEIINKANNKNKVEKDKNRSLLAKILLFPLTLIGAFFKGIFIAIVFSLFSSKSKNKKR